MDLLIVEQRADWSQWNRLTRTLDQPVHVLVQVAGESMDEFYDRVESKIDSASMPVPRRIVVLRDGNPREILVAHNGSAALPTSAAKVGLRRRVRALD